MKPFDWGYLGLECCTSNLYCRANCLNCWDMNWVAWSVYTVAGTPYSANIVLRRLISCHTAWLVSFFTTGNLLKVVGDQQVAVWKMLKYVNSKFEPWQAIVLVAPFVEEACIPFIRHWLHLSHPWARPKDCLSCSQQSFFLLLSGSHEDHLDTLLSMKLEPLVNQLWISGYLQLQVLHGNFNNVAIILRVAASEAANRFKAGLV